MLKILHFADAHIDMANYGRHDPKTGLPMRVMDFLKSLDTIVDAALDEKVDLVLFAGDAYKDRSPAPTFQREWGRRIMRLSRGGIRTFLLVGNHDLSPALGRANAIEEFMTLEVPFVHVLDHPAFYSSEKLGLPLQIIALPWIGRSGLMAHLGLSAINPSQVFEEIEKRLTDLVQSWLEEADPDLPTMLTAHASVQGARYGGERTVMLGSDLVLPRSLVCDPRLDYVALGHIHKPQNLNENAHPPVIYPGSIERVDFGEAAEDKFFILAQMEKGETKAEWRRLDGVRPFVDRYICLDEPEQITQRLIEALPGPEILSEAIVRLTVEYPREWESLLDEPALREYLSLAFDFQLVKRPQAEIRIRLPVDQTIGSLTPMELLEKYWDSAHAMPEERNTLLAMAKDILSQPDRER
jgi:DNA repair protein SbcD/Mre11